MKLRTNKKGMYEYILVKSVMLIFIIGLVSIFMSFYNQQLNSSAQNIANSEAARVAKEIDDVIGFKDMSNTVTIYLLPHLEVGRSQEPYTLTITDTGLVIVKYDNYPYAKFEGGTAQFGIDIARVGGAEDNITCDSIELLSADSHITVTKESEYSYDTDRKALVHTRKVNINALDTCGQTMDFEQSNDEYVDPEYEN